MTLEIDAGITRLRVTDANGHVTLDASHSMFHFKEVLIGSVTLATYTTPPHNGGADYDLGTCNAAHTFVRGVARATWSGTPNALFPSSGWFNIGGSFVQIANYFAVRYWSFVVESGVVRLKDRVYTQNLTTPQGQSVSTLGSITLDYRLFVGRFSP